MYSSRNLAIATVAVALVGGALAIAALQSSQPSLRIVAPEANERVSGTDVEVILEVRGAELVGRASSAGAYVLLQLDQLPPVKCYSNRFTFQGVSEGGHLLRAELRRADGTSMDPPVRARVRFTVVAPGR